MAALTKTITVSVRAFGGGPTTKWGQTFGVGYTMTWGTTKWGEGSVTVIFTANKLIANSLTPDSALLKSARKVITNSVSPTSDPVSETLGSGGWRYVFVSDTTNAEDRDFTSWSEESAGASSYTCLPAGSTTWS